MMYYPATFDPKQELENNPLKEFDPFPLKRGTQIQKKVVVPNKTETLLIIHTKADSEMVAINHPELQVQPNHYGQLRFRFSIPQDYAYDTAKFKVIAKTDDDLIYKTWIFNINIEG
ncbi:hypothetical protein PPERSA_10976 [Pseudocohnilembus persalinus]|uniref:Uncharacterized protein n=1 Tax=Pseudocohnilembus persalinus TaxID=266149 RepID=A0A0V0QCH1_PSEPJ|nr:hypothetical protein PPERSA_10976 [Pseudocohnilembus persalinus]|eukprot:KRW99857.1 hypothetical protein PPERSA_10976 [Pseudocohnilembus persalinus]